jgi:hypothetical protein
MSSGRTCLEEAWEGLEAAEQRAFEARLAGELPGGERSYLVEQTLTLRDGALQDGGVLQLWAPLPRQIAGIQDVQLARSDPSALAEHGVLRAGWLAGVPLWIEPGKVLPVLRLAFAVRQWPAKLSSLGDVALAPVEPHARNEEALVARWLGSAGSAAGAAQARVGAVVDRLEESLRYGRECSPSSLAELLEKGTGSLEALSRLLAQALRSRGFATRLGAAQPLRVMSGVTRFHFEASFGYQHPFVEWRDLEAGEAGVVDLSYLRCWQASGHSNDSERARRWLRRHLHPLELILAGRAPASRLQDPSTGAWTPLEAPVDVTLEVTSLAEATP